MGGPNWKFIKRSFRVFNRSKQKEPVDKLTEVPVSIEYDEPASPPQRDSRAHAPKGEIDNGDEDVLSDSTLTDNEEPKEPPVKRRKEKATKTKKTEKHEMRSKRELKKAASRRYKLPAEEDIFICRALGMNSKGSCLRHADQRITVLSNKFEAIHKCPVCDSESEGSSEASDNNMQNMNKEISSEEETGVPLHLWKEQAEHRLIQVSEWQVQNELRYHPIFGEYFNMFRSGTPFETVKSNCEAAGHESRVLDLDPFRSLESQLSEFDKRTQEKLGTFLESNLDKFVRDETGESLEVAELVARLRASLLKRISTRSQPPSRRSEQNHTEDGKAQGPPRSFKKKPESKKSLTSKKKGTKSSRKLKKESDGSPSKSKAPKSPSKSRKGVKQSGRPLVPKKEKSIENASKSVAKKRKPKSPSSEIRRGKQGTKAAAGRKRKVEGPKQRKKPPSNPQGTPGRKPRVARPRPGIPPRKMSSRNMANVMEPIHEGNEVEDEDVEVLLSKVEMLEERVQEQNKEIDQLKNQLRQKDAIIQRLAKKSQGSVVRAIDNSAQPSEEVQLEDSPGPDSPQQEQGLEEKVAENIDTEGVSPDVEVEMTEDAVATLLSRKDPEGFKDPFTDSFRDDGEVEYVEDEKEESSDHDTNAEDAENSENEEENIQNSEGSDHEENATAEVEETISKQPLENVEEVETTHETKQTRGGEQGTTEVGIAEDSDDTADVRETADLESYGENDDRLQTDDKLDNDMATGDDFEKVGEAEEVGGDSPATSKETPSSKASEPVHAEEDVGDEDILLTPTIDEDSLGEEGPQDGEAEAMSSTEGSRGELSSEDGPKAEDSSDDESNNGDGSPDPSLDIPDKTQQGNDEDEEVSSGDEYISPSEDEYDSSDGDFSESVDSTEPQSTHDEDEETHP